MLTEAQLAALEKAKTEKEAHGEFESEHPGYCGAQDTFYVGNLKGVGRVYQQTFIDTYAKVACEKLYDRKTPITAADLLNDFLRRTALCSRGARATARQRAGREVKVLPRSLYRRSSLRRLCAPLVPLDSSQPRTAHRLSRLARPSAAPTRDGS